MMVAPGLQRGKLRDFNTLIDNQELTPHIPETRSLTTEWVIKMLHDHPILYIKPDNSSQGIGIMRIDRMGELSYMLRTIDTKHYSFYQDVYRLNNAVHQLKRKQSYIVQQGIMSVTQLNYPFDIRVHVVRVSGVWTFGGMIGKVAKRKSIVTNACQGAIPTHIDTILTDFRGLNEEKSKEIKTIIEKVALDAANEMGKTHSGWTEFGLDLGIDENNHIWIYEVNFKPGSVLFRHIDQPAYLHIQALRKQAG